MSKRYVGVVLPSSRSAINVERRCLGDLRQHVIGLVGLVLVGEVDPRERRVQHAARLHDDVDVRRLQGALGTGHTPGLTVSKL